MVFKALKNKYLLLFSASVFLLSSHLAFVSVTVNKMISIMLSLVISLMCLIYVMKHIDEEEEKSFTYGKLFLLCSSIGIASNNAVYFFRRWSISKNLFIIGSNYTEDTTIVILLKIIEVLIAIISVPFIYACLKQFWKRIINIFDNNVFSEITRIEKIVLGSLIIVSSIFVIICMSKSDVFGCTRQMYLNNNKLVPIDYDLIYTSDSSVLTRNNVYLSLTFEENDLRQPLFAVFSAPFMGILYLLYLISGNYDLYIISSNLIQIVMIVFASYLLGALLSKDKYIRIGYIVFMCMSYTYLLSILMMEQYAVAYFYLVLAIYVIHQRKREDMALIGAGGTLLTSVSLMPLFCGLLDHKDLKSLIKDTIKCAFRFVFVMLIFARFDVIFELVSKFQKLVGFTGEKISFSNKIIQFSWFIRNCFIAPEASVNYSLWPYPTWQLNKMTAINYLGIVILIICVFSFLINHKKTLSKIAVLWVFYSIFLLLIVGWGSAENGLILYCLYFSWAYQVLIFQLLEHLDIKLGRRIFIPLLLIYSLFMLLTINKNGIGELIGFAIKYYPK